MEKNPEPASRQSAKPATDALQSQPKFLFVNKNAGSKYLSRSFAPGEELLIRRHVKQNTDGRGQTRRGRGVGGHASTSSKPGRRKPKGPAQDLTLSKAPKTTSSDDSHDRATKLALDTCSDLYGNDRERCPLKKLSEIPPQLLYGSLQQNVQPHADPARLFDPFNAAPIPLDSTARKILRWYLASTYNDTSEVFKSKLAPAMRRLQTRMNLWMAEAYRNRASLACAVASTSVSGHLFHKLVPRSDALRHTDQAVSRMRVEVAAAKRATPELFFCMLQLFNVEAFLGNGEGAIVHTRAIWHMWTQLGGFDALDPSTSALCMGFLFFQRGVNWWDANPPIPPFWKPEEEDLPWPPRLMHTQPKIVQPGKTTSSALDSHILPKSDVRRFIRPILSYARDRLGVSEEDIGNFSWEFYNFKMRQRLFCMRTNDSRIHVLRQAIHALVVALSGYAWLNVCVSETCRVMKADLALIADHEWKGERHLRVFCLVVGTVYTSESWFVRELETLYSDWQTQDILQDFQCACGPFVQPNLVSIEALESLAKDIAGCSDEQDPGPDANQTDLSAPDDPPYGNRRRYWEPTAQMPEAWQDK